MTDATDFLTPNDVCNLLEISRVTLDRWIERGWFPAPIRLPPANRFLRWQRDVVDEARRKMEPANQKVEEGHQRV